ncbi:MAG: LTA synthase family protein, partial [Planctomycetota bacterium]
MTSENSKSVEHNEVPLLLHRLYAFLAQRACTAIIFAALFCTLYAKFYHACKTDHLQEYPSWILADLVVLLSTEFILSLISFRWKGKTVIRITVSVAAVFCTWSVVNAGWLLGRGVQILPSVVLSLFTDPINRLAIIGHHLTLNPFVAVQLLLPSAVALVFLFMVLAHPVIAVQSRRHLINRFIIYSLLIVVAALANGPKEHDISSEITSRSLRYNCQLKAVTSLFTSRRERKTIEQTSSVSQRKIPAFDQLDIELRTNEAAKYNVIIIILEGIGFKHTSLYDGSLKLTPYLEQIARQGVLIANTRPPVTHSTKGFFSIHTGRLPSVSGDFVEALPLPKPYASIATILKYKLGYRTAFFQSAKGNFECRPGLVHNLGFDKFWTREYAENPDNYLGYLASDEFSMLDPVTDWIKQDRSPFLLTMVLSATHDPYEVPDWFGQNEGKPLEKYHRTITYTDSFIKALDNRLKTLNCRDNTILCIIGDHGEAFGEHQRFGHDLIPFDEALSVVWLMRGPAIKEKNSRIYYPATSLDVTPTLLWLLGFDIQKAGFDGVDIFTADPLRKIYFSGWVHGTAAGYVKRNNKYVYDPTNKIVVVYDLARDPNENTSMEITGPKAQEIIAEVTQWKDKTFMPLYNWQQTKELMLYDYWRIYRLRS